MTLPEMHRLAQLAGLTVEQQPFGYRLSDEGGRVIASQLPKAQSEALIQGRLRVRFLDLDRAFGLLH